jgi:DNA-binding GntR family transcriptional regulator
VSKQERSYETIRRRILAGTYGPGYRLTIDALAKELGMSQAPVREAIRRLEAEGLMIYRPNVGAQVSPVDEERWEGAMATLALLEGYATALAAPVLGPGHLSQLRYLNASMKRAVDSLDIMAFSELNREFHSEIYGRCSNDYLIVRIDETLDQLNLIRATVLAYIPQRCRTSIDEHEQLIVAIERCLDFTEVEHLARAHKLRTMEAYIAYRRRVASSTDGS